MIDAFESVTAWDRVESRRDVREASARHVIGQARLMNIRQLQRASLNIVNLTTVAIMGADSSKPAHEVSQHVFSS